MEFTPKKQKPSSSVYRHNPYASGGQKYLNNFRKNRATNGPSLYISPRYNCKANSYGSTKFKPRSLTLSRTEKLLQNSHSIQKEKLKANEFKSTTFAPKSVISQADSTKKDESLWVESDSDDEIFFSSKKGPESDKENFQFKSLKFYPKKKAPTVLKSKIAQDISPIKLQRCYGDSSNSRLPSSEIKVVKDKENLSTNVRDPTGIEFPHLIGFPNYGNTCYLNAVVQTLMGLSCFTQEIGQAMRIAQMSPTSISYSLWNVILNRQKCQIPDTRKALRVLKTNFEKLDGSFSGFKMQDANEFLTRVLDAIKDEIDKISQNEFSAEGSTSTSPNHVSSSNNIPTSNGDVFQNDIEIMDETSSIFDTPSQDSNISLDIKPAKNTDLSTDDFELILKSESKENSDDDLMKNVVKSSQGLLAMYLVTPAKSSSKNPPSSDLTLPNPIQKNFEFELLESYRCLGCSQVVGRKQRNFALYINLPKGGGESLQKAIEFYASEDQRELTCEKCDHKTSSVVTTFTKFPRILIVQLKRYEFKADLLECIKVSSKVDVNLWLHLNSLSSDSIEAPPEWSPEAIVSYTPKEKPSTLSVRNLSSELNICVTAGGEESPPPVTTTEYKMNLESSDENSAAKEDKEMQEVMLRSIEDQGGAKSSDPEASREKEEEEFQRAIQLSLQEVGMAYSFNDQELEEEANVQNLNLEEENTPGPHSYRLMSVISHFGLTTCTGHYVADVFNVKDSCWYHYDDESVSKIQENVLLADGRKQNGYIFFYVHNDIYQQLISEN